MITIRDLHKAINGTAVLKGVSLHVKRGEVAALLGPSGGGKSTLLRTINGLERFDQGEIQIDDVTMGPVLGPERDQAIRKIRQRVGMVFQQFHLFPFHSALQNVTEAPIHVLGQSPKEAESHARELLDRVGLGDKLSAMPHQLSGGQQQRVAIARALALRPEAILFDEPTSALDPRMTGEVIEVMTDLAQSGQTMIVVTHAMNLARRVAHTVHVMHAGRIAESGSTDQIFENPHEETTRAFLAEGQEG